MLSPFWIVVGSDIRIRTKLKSILLLIVFAGDSNNPVGAQCLGEHDTKVTQSTNTDDSNSLSRATAIVSQRRVGGNTTAQHGSSLRRGNGIGDLNNEVGRATVVQRITTKGPASVHEGGVVRSGHVDRAVGLIVGGTLLTVALPALARFTLGADTDAIADLDAALSLGSDTHSNADDLVADAAGVCGRSLH